MVDDAGEEGGCAHTLDLACGGSWRAVGAGKCTAPGLARAVCCSLEIWLAVCAKER